MRNTNYDFDEIKVKKVMPLKDIIKIQKMVHKSVYANDRLRKYIVDLCVNTQPPHTRNKKDITPENLDEKNWLIDYNQIKMGSSPRGAEYIQKVAKTHAFVQGRDFVTLDDIHYVAKDILRHRIILNPSVDQKVTADDILEEILYKTKLPE